jgi:squalene synthase HpnC
MPPEPLELDACYHYCEALARARHHNFPVASVFAPSQLKRHIWAVYAFARCADDFADEPEYEGRRTRELDRWEERLQSCYYGEPPDHPVFVALADTVRTCQLPITEFTALLSGFRTDLEKTRYDTFTELRGYTALSSEPLGRLILYMGGYREPMLHHFMDDLCTGLSMAKLLQDIPADYERGRVYIPAEDLRHFGVTERHLRDHLATPEVAALVRYEVARSRALFERARPLVDLVGNSLGIEMALVWHGGMRILDKIQATGPKLLRRRPHIDSLDKAQVVLRSLAWRGNTMGPRLIGRLARRS